jgi:hypothetical protein
VTTNVKVTFLEFDPRYWPVYNARLEAIYELSFCASISTAFGSHVPGHESHELDVTEPSPHLPTTAAGEVGRMFFEKSIVGVFQLPDQSALPQSASFDGVLGRVWNTRMGRMRCKLCSDSDQEPLADKDPNLGQREIDRYSK